MIGTSMIPGVDELLDIYLESNVVFTIDDTFVISVEGLQNARWKYGISQDENIGIVIIGGHPVKYSTILTSERFLMYCGDNKIYEFYWSMIRSVSHNGNAMTIILTNNCSINISDSHFGDDLDIRSGNIHLQSQEVVKLMQIKIYGKDNNQQEP